MAEDTAAERTNRLVALRRLDSADKAGRVITALEATLQAGEPLTIAALARHAGATSASARVTVASLRADLTNSKATNHRLTTELGALRRRLGQQLGQDVLAGLDRATIDTSATNGRLAEVEQALFETGEELARRIEELDAARQINRELIGRLNRERH